MGPPSVLAWRRAGKHRKTTLEELLAGRRLPVVHADDILEGVADRLMSENVAHFPVVSPVDQRLLGYIGWKDLMRVRTRLEAQEHERKAFIGFGRRS